MKMRYPFCAATCLLAHYGLKHRPLVKKESTPAMKASSEGCSVLLCQDMCHGQPIFFPSKNLYLTASLLIEAHCKCLRHMASMAEAKAVHVSWTTYSSSH